ncbi:HK97-gp10 family putative phage morphogenesis protein [Entomohabitans teleogrylli]|uniref:HK97-gp10 family putative phage morphogenesis protein n=1 Tax=Entomohabitans teleogrylli TaxID=1384589 RepID=UPI000AC36891|nr:HK97-gp10 family putative phage morphogenesis protein [Entomohabitans teleogrylli]
MMADEIVINLTGLDPLIGKMRAVSDVTRNKAGRHALRQAANVLRDRARRSASRVDNPMTREAIFKNIVASWGSVTFKRTGNLAFRVGVMGGARQYAKTKENVRRGRAGKTYKTAGDNGNPGGDTWYWRFLEFGTQHAAAKPIFRPIINGPDAAVINVFAAEFERALDRAIQRASRGAA